MLYFERWRQSKKLPQKGDIIYLIPIRYWEPDDYKPIKFIVEKAEIGEDKVLSMYGVYQKEASNMYASVDIDAEWYYSYKNARKAQLLLNELYDIIGDDENRFIVDMVLKEERIM